MKESDGLSLLVTNVRSLKKQSTILKTKTQKQPLKETEPSLKKPLAENALKPKDKSKAENESNQFGHEPTQLGTQKYGCPFCSKTMPKHYDMKRHILIHTGDKPFTCNICEKAFNRKSHLNVHSLIHTGEMPFSCTICNKTFRYRNCLKIHIANVHFEKIQIV